MHAEMNVLRFSQPGDEIEVVRYRKRDRDFTMAKPCGWCMDYIRKAGIKKIRYTDWNGSWVETKIGE